MKNWFERNFYVWFFFATIIDLLLLTWIAVRMHP